MSSENKEETAMEVVVAVEEQEAEIDELRVAFELLEEKTSDSPADYQGLLLNPRMDDAAVKIKEQCIYK